MFQCCAETIELIESYCRLKRSQNNETSILSILEVQTPFHNNQLYWDFLGFNNKTKSTGLKWAIMFCMNSTVVSFNHANNRIYHSLLLSCDYNIKYWYDIAYSLIIAINADIGEHFPVDPVQKHSDHEKSYTVMVSHTITVLEKTLKSYFVLSRRILWAKGFPIQNKLTERSILPRRLMNLFAAP